MKMSCTGLDRQMGNERSRLAGMVSATMDLGESMAALKRVIRVGLVLMVPAVTIFLATANHLQGL
jgi:phage tail protein X